MKSGAFSVDDALRRGLSPSLGDPSDFALIRAPKGFKWRGEDAARLPLLSDKTGRLLQPVTIFFGESARLKRVSISSMYGEAGILREWLAYLAARNIPWTRVRDQTLIEWKTQLEEAAAQANRKADNDKLRRLEVDVHNRIVRKLEVVFQFYLRCGSNSYAISEEIFVSPRGPIRSQVKLGGPTKFRRNAAFGSTASIDDQMWAFAPKRRTKLGQRPTPDEDDVRRILTHLRTPTGQSESATNRGRPRQPTLHERDWLIGRTMTEAGLRADECSKLGVYEIARGLRKAGIVLPERSDIADLAPTTPSGPLHPLDLVGFSPAAQASLLQELDLLERRHRKSIFVPVTGKGQKSREAPFPIGLVRDLLTIGIWLVRKSDVVARGSKRARAIDAVFLPAAARAERCLTASYIGDLMKSAFDAAGVPASGHRLRAWYATRTCAALFEEAFALNGNRWDQTVENLVLEQLAQAMGHARVTTAIRHYLDRQLMEFLGLRDKSKLAMLRKTSWLLAGNSAKLEKADFRRIEELVNRLAAGLPTFRDLLDEIISDPAFSIETDAKPLGQSDSSMASGLRLVSSDRSD